jgi:hypothetical protein
MTSALAAPVASLSASVAAAVAAGEGEAKVSAQQARTEQTAAMQRIFNGLKVVANQHGGVHLIVQHGQRIEPLPIESEAAIEHIMLAVKTATGTAVSKDTILRELGPIKAQARRDGTVRQTHTRCAQHGAGYVCDLGDADGNAVSITADGWTVGNQHDVLFVRDAAYGELPMPERFDSVSDALAFGLGWLKRQGVPEAISALVLVVLVEYLRPNTPHPILVFVGEAGSGKSGATTRIAQCIDPTKSGALADIKLTPEDMAAAAQCQYVLSADNLTKLSADVQDLLCKVSTGTVATVRKYYSQSEALRLALHNPMLLPCINLCLTAPDALNRAIIAQIKRPLAYRNDDELKAEFKAEQPKVTGAMYTLLAAALAKLPEVVGQRQWLDRLVDYLQLGEAVMQSAGHESGYFLGLFKAHRAKVASDVSGGDSFTQALFKVLRDISKQAQPGDKLPPWRQWGEGKNACGFAVVATDDGKILIAIKVGALRAKLPVAAQYIPENERQLSAALTRVAPMLRAVGVRVEKRDAPGGRTVWGFSCDTGALDE